MSTSQSVSSPIQVAQSLAETARGVVDTMTGRLASVANFNSKLFEAYTEGGRAYVKQLSAVSEELTNFANKRFTEAAQFRDALVTCKDWGDALRTQQDFVQASSKDYVDQATRLAKIISQTTLAGLDPLVKTVKTLPEHASAAKKAAAASLAGSSPKAA